jgi:hypothetical protein
VTTKDRRRVGLGLSLFAQAAARSSGKFSVQSSPDHGTRIRAEFQHSHIDRQPLGDIGQTVRALVMGNPDVDFVFTHEKNGRRFQLDTKEMKTRLGDRSMAAPQWLRAVGEDLARYTEQMNRG